MLQTYSSQSEVLYNDGGQNLGLGHYLGILKSRALYFAIPFVLVLLLGSFITAIQRPLYEAKGKVLVEAQEIPTDLVRPTVMETANQRIQVIQQRIMTRDNLLELAKKYNMFARQQQWMSDTQLLDLMRDRTKFELVDIDSAAGRSGPSTIAFTISFQYEKPDVTARVANDFLTLILKEDARNRTAHATETTNFLTRESQRLQGELTAIESQIAQMNTNPIDEKMGSMDPARIQIVELTRLKEELAQKTSTYSPEYPGIRALKKKIAAMEELVKKTPLKTAEQANSGVVELERKAVATEKGLEETNKKLDEARLGERLERDQQSERLQVIEQPIQPQRPVKPNRFKLMGLSLALAMAAGVGTVFAAESLDTSIRNSRELAGVANGHPIVAIPYIFTRAEVFRRKSRIALFGGLTGVLLLAGVVWYAFFGPSIDLSWVNQYWIDQLTNLSNRSKP
jgi:uncharacterized protein involved in exopolysaccharide biosynthesis